MKSGGGKITIPDVLLRIIRRIPDSPGRRNALAAVLWQQSVGTILGKHSFVEAMDEQGTLRVAVDDKTWVQPLNNSRKEILRRMNATRLLPGITGMRFTVRPAPHPSAGAIPDSRADEDPDIVTEIESAISDPDLREGFLRVYRSHSRRKND